MEFSALSGLLDLIIRSLQACDQISEIYLCLLMVAMAVRVFLFV